MTFPATVAQLVEQLIRNHQVSGSNPLGGSKSNVGTQNIVSLLNISRLYGIPPGHNPRKVSVSGFFHP